MYLGSWRLDDTVAITATTHQFSSGAAYAPTYLTYSIYEDATTTGIDENVDMIPASPFDGITGFYLARRQLTAAAGFEKGKNYTVLVKATVDGVAAIAAHTFQVEAEVDANTVSPTVSADVVSISGGATAADNCELMFDGTGYAGGTTKLGVDVVAISADTTAADNCELMFDGTGYAGGTIKLGTDLVSILGTALTETSGLIAAAFKKFFNVATPTGTVNSLPDAVPGAASGVFIAGTNAATTITTALTANITGNLSGSVGSVTGAVTLAATQPAITWGQQIVTTAAGAALTLSSTGANGAGLVVSGNGSGAGIDIDAGATGNAVDIAAAGGMGVTVLANVAARGALDVVNSNNTGIGLRAYGLGATANGMLLGAAGGGAGLAIQAPSGQGISVGAGMEALNMYGNDLDGGRCAVDIFNQGTSADTVRLDHLGGGRVVQIRGTGSVPAVDIHHYGSGPALKLIGGDTTGNAVEITTTDGDGIVVTAAGAGHYDINADIHGSLDGTIGGLTAAALKDFFDTDSTTTYAAAVAGSVVKEIADNATVSVSDIADSVWNEARADHTAAGSFGQGVASVQGNVTGSTASVTTVNDKIGYKLAADGLDTISMTAPAGVASNFREAMVAVWRRFFKRATMTATTLNTYADNDIDVLTSQAVADDGTTQTQGSAT